MAAAIRTFYAKLWPYACYLHVHGHSYVVEKKGVESGPSRAGPARLLPNFFAGANKRRRFQTSSRPPNDPGGFRSGGFRTPQAREARLGVLGGRSPEKFSEKIQSRPFTRNSRSRAALCGAGNTSAAKYRRRRRGTAAVLHQWGPPAQ